MLRDYSRDETSGQRLDRNFTEQLQEVRIAQAGTQILFAFLLTLPFQQRFTTLTSFQRGVYVATLIATAVSVVLFTAPVAMHRVLFHRGVKDFIVTYTARLTSLGLIALGLGIVGGVTLVLDVMLSHAVALAMGAGVALLALVFWVAVPEWHKRRLPLPPDDATGQEDKEDLARTRAASSGRRREPRARRLGALFVRRRRRDLNPRGVLSPTRLAGGRTRPLCDASTSGTRPVGAGMRERSKATGHAVPGQTRGRCPSRPPPLAELVTSPRFEVHNERAASTSRRERNP